MVRTVEFEGMFDCVEISNGDAAVVISTRFGPRILFYGLQGAENILGWHPNAAVETEFGTWKPYGGHRLWVAPENMPLSYAPDNDPVQYETAGELSAVFRTTFSVGYPVEKEMKVSLSPTGSTVAIEHRLTNISENPIELAAWALTIMRPSGTVIIPNEPHAGYSSENLLPIRSIAIWPYTDFTDPRWMFAKDSLRLKVDENIHGPQKCGVLNKQGWAAYEWEDMRFVKRAAFIEGAVYPDMNSNFEFYTDGGFVEIETLSPIRTVVPGGSIKHEETWELGRTG